MLSDVSAALSASPKASIDEHPGTLSVTGKLSVEALTAWRSVAQACAAYGCELVCRDSLGDVQTLETADLAIISKGSLRLTVNVAPPAGTLLLFTSQGLRRALAPTQDLSGVAMIYALGVAEAIETEGVAIQPWQAAAGPATLRSAKYPSPRRFARTVAGDTRAPLEIDSWLIKHVSTRDDESYLIWREAAAGSVLRSLVNELYEADGKVHVLLSGSPVRRLELGTLTIESAQFDLLQRAGRWVYAEGNDVELRHTLLTNELAREWRDGEAFATGLPKWLETALESAGLAYRAHVQQGSRDTIKSLGDLRKTLAEEIAKVNQQTRDQAANLWRDIAVAIVTIAFRFSLDAAKAASAASAFAIIFLLVAAYIVTSQSIAVFSNRRFLKVASDARATWRRKGYGYLSDEEFETLAEVPIASARAVYDRVETLANWTVGIVTTGLVSAAILESGLALALWRKILEVACS